jgi:nucleoside-diphosphate-sugar epimerase
LAASIEQSNHQIIKSPDHRIPRSDGAVAKLLLIGGSGFIGSHVTAALVRGGHDVVVFHRGSQRSPGQEMGMLPAAVREIHGDRRQLPDHAESLRAVRPDVVVDFVLSSGRRARELMTLFRGVASQVVALSSADVYRACGIFHGLEPGPIDPVPLTESSPLRTRLQTYPIDRIRRLQQIFGWLDEEYDKIPVEQEILGDASLPGTVLRLPMVYGPGDRLHRLFPLVKRMDDRRPFILFDEKLAAWRGPRGYVENVAAAIALAATSPQSAGQIYNVGEVESLSELEWARQVGAAVGWSGRIVTLPREKTPHHLRMPGNLDQHWAMDTTRIRRELGYVEPIARAEAIRRTAEWERAHRPPVDPRAFDYDAEDLVIEGSGD